MAYRGEGQYWSLNQALMWPLMLDANPDFVQDRKDCRIKGLVRNLTSVSDYP